MITPERLDEIEERTKFLSAGAKPFETLELITAVRAYQKLLSEGVRVYGWVEDEDVTSTNWGTNSHKSDTHTGLLVDVKKIEG